ncbi:DUF2267 domain-containing protein [Aureimonas fodinaquatilis]|uniref:DUF2267 domain-containing protein n=2 Tax=Aureimonas fodinaquatilis TaxID=2565783 RepID=A0A5B0E228_9HYPH|nr:DUF2267 domain-containing protein [Aureimonas fodinaquatilis]
MDEYFTRIGATADVPAEMARKAIGYILAYMQAESQDGSIAAMIAATPAAAEALGDADGYDGEGGIMALGSRLMGLGLDMGQIRDMAEEFISAARASAGDEVVDRAIASVPALAQFI